MKTGKGLFVCFEGIDGSGKTTQTRLFKRALEKKGAKFLMLSYPDYSSPYGKIIGRYLHKKIDMSPADLFLIFLADMVKDAELIRKSIDKGMVVISDRYLYSTIAYQCAAGYDYKNAKELEDSAELPLPSFIFYIDMPAELTFKRKIGQKGKTDRNESNTKYMRKVRSYYSKLFAEGYTGVKCITADGTCSVKSIHERVMNSVKAVRPDLVG